MKFSEFLTESTDNVVGNILKGVRSSKLNKKGETSLKYVLDPEDKKLVAYIWERYERKYVFIALKTEKIDTAQPTHFVKVDKPKIGAFTNNTIDTSDKPAYNFNKKTTVEEILKVFNSKDDRIVISEKADKYLKTTIELSDEDPEPEELFAIGYWSNPYRAGDREYFWFGNTHGDFESKKDILAAAKRKCERGQPTRFRDFMSGTATAYTSREKFLAAAKKVGLNPRIDD